MNCSISRSRFAMVSALLLFAVWPTEAMSGALEPAHRDRILSAAAEQDAVDPLLVGTWKSTVRNAQGEWTFTWQQEASGAYRTTVSGPAVLPEDTGKFIGQQGKWRLVAASGRTDRGIYIFSDADTLTTRGAGGAMTWKRVAAAKPVAPVAETEKASSADATKAPAVPEAQQAYDQASELARARKWKEAIALLDRAVELDPGSARYVHARGYCHAMTNSLNLALRDYDKAIELDPKDASAFLNRGNSRLSLEKNEEALQDFDKVIELQPNNAWAHGNRGIALERLGRLDEAQRAFDECLRLEPALQTQYKHHVEAIQKTQRQQRFGRAPEKPLAGRTRVGGYGEAHLKKAIQLIEEGKEKEALGELDSAIATTQHDNYVAYLLRGRVFVKLGRRVAASNDLNASLKLEPKQSEPYYWIGLGHATLGSFDSALENFDDAARRGYANKDLLHHRGDLLYSMQRYEEAIRDYSEYLKHGENAQVLAGRARAYAWLGRVSEMRRDFDRCVALDPRAKGPLAAALKGVEELVALRKAAEKIADPKAALDQGQKRLQARQYLAAASHFEQAARLKPDSVAAYLGMAWAYTYTDNTRLAVWNASRAVKIDSKNAEARLILGWSYRQLREAELAHQVFTRAIELKPDYGAAYYGRAKLLHLDMRRDIEAQSDYVKAIELEPRNATFQLGLADFLFEWTVANETFEHAEAAYSRVIELDPGRAHAYLRRAVCRHFMQRQAEAQADLAQARRLAPSRKYEEEYKVTCDLLTQVIAAYRKMRADMAAGWSGGSSSSSGSGANNADSDKAAQEARDKYNKDVALQNAWSSGDNNAYERIQRGESTWGDKSKYGY